MDIKKHTLSTVYQQICSKDLGVDRQSQAKMQYIAFLMNELHMSLGDYYFM